MDLMGKGVPQDYAEAVKCSWWPRMAIGNTPEEALKLLGVNVGKAARQTRSEQVNKAPRFF
jgi:hypothetical protein